MGNVTDNSKGIEYIFDAGGRMNDVFDTALSTRLAMVYNGMGELARTRKTGAGCNQQELLLALEYFTFTPDGRALELVSGVASRVESDWVWLDDMPVAQFSDSYDAGGTYQGTTITYLYADHLGTPRLGTDPSGAISWRYESDAFGKGTPTGTAVVRLRLPGQISLELGGVNFNYFRDYDPNVGRYVESDPIGLAGGINTYAYVGANPISRIDPTGEDYWVEDADPSESGLGLHQSICVGKYGSKNRYCISFGRKPGQGDCWFDCDGHVYQDRSPAGDIVNPMHRKTSTAVDRKILQIGRAHV